MHLSSRLWPETDGNPYGDANGKTAHGILCI